MWPLSKMISQKIAFVKVGIVDLWISRVEE